MRHHNNDEKPAKGPIINRTATAAIVSCGWLLLYICLIGTQRSTIDFHPRLIAVEKPVKVTEVASLPPVQHNAATIYEQGE